MTSRKMRKSTMTGFGQYPDSVFKEQVSASWVRSRGWCSLFAGLGGSPSPDGEAGPELWTAQPQRPRPGQCPGQGQSLIGPDGSRDLNTGLPLVEADLCLYLVLASSGSSLTSNLKPKRWPWDRVCNGWIHPPPLNRSRDQNTGLSLVEAICIHSMFFQGLESDGVWRGGEQADDGWG